MTAQTTAPNLERGTDGIYLVAFPSTWLQLDVRGWSERQRYSWQQVQQLPSLYAAIAGPMWHESGRTLAMLYQPSKNINIASRVPRYGLSVNVFSDGSIQCAHGAKRFDGASLAVQGFPSLIENRVAQPTTEHDSGGEWRSALVAWPAHKWIGFAIGHMGMDVFRDRLLRRGIPWAVYTDGGSSTNLVSATQRVGHPRPRTLPGWLEAIAPPCGPSTLAKVGLGVGALAAAWYLLGGPSRYL